MDRLIRNESGSISLIVALLMVVLIGFSAIALDYGNIAGHHRKLQNAVDASCLAAAQYLPVKIPEAKDVAANYLSANAPGAIVQSITLNNSNKIVTVTAHLDVDYMFARAFVSERKTIITAKATAIITNVFGPYDYALFSGSEIDLLQFTGQNYIQGDVHSNDSVKNSATVSGTVTAAGIIDGKITSTNKVPGYNVLAMPDFSNVLDLASPVNSATLESYGATYKNGTYTMSPDQFNALAAAYASKPIYISGNLTIDGSGVCGTGTIIVSDNIKFNGSGVDMSAGYDLCLATLNGSIDFDGGGGLFRGILFAPKGTINFNGRIDSIRGSVLANVVKGNGGLNIYYDPQARDSLPDTEIMLVE